MKRVVWILVVMAAGAAAAFYRGKQRADVDAKIDGVQERLADLCSKSAGFEKYQAFFESGADAAHEHAINIAYTPAGRRTPPSFDAVKYANAFCDSSIARATRTKPGDHELSTFLRQMQIDVESAAKSGALD